MRCRKWEVRILRWHEGALDARAEALLLQHLESCAHCRTLADKFSAMDSMFENSQAPVLPPFLRERIVSSVYDAMRQDSTRGIFSRFLISLVSLRPAVAMTLLVLGIGLGMVTGWNLAQAVSRGAPVSSYDLLSVAGFGGAGGGSSLDFIWTDSNGSAGR